MDLRALCEKKLCALCVKFVFPRKAYKAPQSSVRNLRFLLVSFKWTFALFAKKNFAPFA